QAEDGIRDFHVTGVQTCALPIIMHCLAGMQIGDGVYAFVNTTPSFASQSNTGVRTISFPANPATSGLCSSLIKNKIFGCTLIAIIPPSLYEAPDIDLG